MCLIHCSGKNKTTVSGLLAQQKGRKHDKVSTNNNTTHDNLITERREQYLVGVIYMVAQTYIYVQFHNARKQTISANDISVIYLSIKEKHIIPLGSHVNSLEHVGSSIERIRLRTHMVRGSGKDYLTNTVQDKGALQR